MEELRAGTVAEDVGRGSPALFLITMNQLSCSTLILLADAEAAIVFEFLYQSYRNCHIPLFPFLHKPNKPATAAQVQGRDDVLL